MSIHIGAKPGEIAETVLIFGDPLRAKYVAEKMLSDFSCYTEVRNMLGFTGWYNGKRVSVQGTGMGVPSTAIYVHELIHEYGARKIIRVGTCGAIQRNLELGQLILAEEAYTDSCTHNIYFGTMDIASKADPSLVHHAKETAKKLSTPVVAGAIFTTDTFYSDDTTRWQSWTNRGLLCVEMESSILYAMAAKDNIQALSILSVSDNILNKKYLSAKERETASEEMMKLALEIR